MESYIVTKSKGILFYKDNFHSPKFTTIFTDKKGDEHRRWTFKFSSKQWEIILSKDFLIGKAIAENEERSRILAGSFDITVTRDGIDIYHSASSYFRKGIIHLTFKSWQKVRKMRYPSKWKPLNSMDCEVKIDLNHHLHFNCHIFWQMAFINEDTKEELFHGPRLFKYKTKAGIILSISYADEHAYIEFPPKNKWPICLDSVAYNILNERLKIPPLQD